MEIVAVLHEVWTMENKKARWKKRQARLEKKDHEPKTEPPMDS
jgi:hypothetical protein